jgi:hypothetical protein
MVLDAEGDDVRDGPAVVMSTTATALFSCSATYAVVLSALTATYSGSKSCAAVAPGPKTRTPSGTAPLKAVKSAVATLASMSMAAPPDTSMMLTLPSGSVW